MLSDTMLAEIKKIVGEANVSATPEAKAKMLKPGKEAPGLVLVAPGSTEDIQEIVKIALKNKIPIVTSNDFYLSEEDLEKEGVLLDFCRMNRIERIDKRNLIAHIERGVTWEQLNAELEPLGIKVMPPIAANSNSVLECCVARTPIKAINKFSDYALANMKVVLADGTVQKTGSHALNEAGGDIRYDGGPNISYWYICADDIFGIVTRVSIHLYPIYQERSCLLFGFDDCNKMLEAMKNISRTELAQEYVGFNRTSMQRILSNGGGDLPEWTLAVGFEAREKLVRFQESKVKLLMEKYGGKVLDKFEDVVASELDKVGAPDPNNTMFFSLFSKFKGLDEKADAAAKAAGVKEVGKTIVSYNLGRGVVALYEWFSDEDKAEAIEKLNLDICLEGAFFDRPLGKLGRKIYNNMSKSTYMPFLKHIKKIMDPEDLLNPGRTIDPESREWLPPEVGGDGITPGINITNMKKVKEKLAEAVGAEWVSDNPADLNCYSRDFTIFSGERPNIVVLPSSTEEVQRIIKIAYQHGVPIVPLSTGFNHGGLTVSRKGGILIDLKRLDETYEIDEDSMSVTVDPHVRMRSVWFDAIKHRATDGFHLKPILPLTFGSVSLLSNYVARGGPGEAVKYGSNTELTIYMKWILANGEILETGPNAVPGVGKLGIHYGPGPEISGMFFNADGMFGVCTALSAKLYPEGDNIEDVESVISAVNIDMDFDKSLLKTIDCMYDVTQENIVDFTYKSHPCVAALTAASKIEGVTMEDIIAISPKHPLAIIVSGYDQEEVDIKTEIITELCTKNELFIMSPEMMGIDPEEIDTKGSTDIMKKSMGILNNILGSYRGAFQWTASLVKTELIPEISKEFEKLVEKYWKTSDPAINLELSMTGSDIQGPSPFCRSGSCEFDFWWDQGNPESVKRATVMLHKTNKLLIKHGGVLFRNMFGSGEYYIPKLGRYYELLKVVKKEFDPANLMHPDVLPVAEDYV